MNKTGRSAFTLAELLVVVAVLAVLATVGFVAFSGFSGDARETKAKANVRLVHSAISTESIVAGVSPRRFIRHDSAYALSGSSVAVFNESSVTLVPGLWNAPGTNYSAGNPDYAALRLNPDKFRTASVLIPPAFAELPAATDPNYVLVAAADLNSATSGGSKIRTFVQSAGILESSKAFVVGDSPSGAGGSVSGLIRDPSNPTGTGALVDGAQTGAPVSCASGYGWDSGTHSCAPSVDGVCGPSAGNAAYSYPSSGYCSLGTNADSDATGADGTFDWSCAGQFGGTSVSCSAPKKSDGVCWSSNGQTLASAPSSGLCSAGSASPVSGTGPWNWTCAGSNGGNSPSCSASSTSFAFNYAISSNTSNFDLRSAAISAGWNQVTPIIATVTVSAGVVVGSNSTSAYAFDTGAPFPAGSTLSLFVNGGSYIVGKGGDGGYSGQYPGSSPGAGGAGGPALRAQYPITITNNGTIGGGGGGGGGNSCNNCTSGGGGGAGSVVGSGGGSVLWARLGAAGTLTAGGTGGYASVYYYAGNGGALGAAGANAYSQLVPALVGAGGAGGASVMGNSNITWVAAGTRLGSVNN